jgi:hypothetical protein
MSEPHQPAVDSRKVERPAAHLDLLCRASRGPSEEVAAGRSTAVHRRQRRGPTRAGGGTAIRRRRAPMEHWTQEADQCRPLIMTTSGLSRAPVSASEHRSSTGTTTCDRQRILSTACVQVKDLLRVRRQGLEPRTRGLRARTSPCRVRSAAVGLCYFPQVSVGPGVVVCRRVSACYAATEHCSSTAAMISARSDGRGGGVGIGRSSGLSVC